MIKTMEELKKVELEAVGVTNGVDSPNLLSVNSIEPFRTEIDTPPQDPDAPSDGKKEETVTPSEPAAPQAGKVKEPAEEVAKPTEETPATSKEAETSETPAEKKKSVSGVEKRIGKITKQWRTTERQLESERRRTERLQAENLELRKAVPAKDKPKSEDFESQEEYLDAYAEWTLGEKKRTQDVEAATVASDEQAAQAGNEAEDSIDEAIERGRVKYEDFADVVYAETLTMTQEMVDAITLSDVAEDVLYYLGTHPEEAAALKGLSSLKIAREVGRIEAVLLAEEDDSPAPNASSTGSLSADETPNQPATPAPPVIKAGKIVTDAPAPINPVHPDGILEKRPEDMSAKEYREWRKK